MKMEFNEFTQEVAGKIKSYLPSRFSDAEVGLKVVTKNNGTQLTGLTIKTVDSNIAPTLYLERFFEDYENGKDLVKILNEIADARVATEVEGDFDTEFLMKFEDSRSRIVPRLVSQEMNKALLESRPHKIIADLAVTYHVMVNNLVDGAASVAVTNEIMDRWGVTVDDLHDAAIENIPVLQSSTFQSMSDVLFESMGRALLRQYDGDEERAREAFREFMPVDADMHVLSTVHKMYGAAALLDKNMMAHIYEKFDGRFYIVPSSTHEVLIVNDMFDKESLASIIHEVNEGTVDVEDRLSDHLYVYDLKRGLMSA
jgi:hypothetical protein